MKGLHAWIAGTLLTASLSAAPPVSAGDDHHTNTDVRSWSVDRDADGRVWSSGRVLLVSDPGMAQPGTRILYVIDDPRYDLSGSGDALYLIEDGSVIHADVARGAAAYAGASPGPRQVAKVPASYRQDWMAVAAGDRKVRVVSPQHAAATEASNVSYVPVRILEADSRYDRDRYRGARYTDASGKRYHKRSTLSHRKARTSSTTVSAKRAAHKRHKATVATSRPYRPRATYANASATPRRYATAGYEPRRSRYEARMVEATRPIVEERDLYQIGNSWYREENGVWSRGYSWRGPFVPVKTGRVPREVIDAAKRGS